MRDRLAGAGFSDVFSSFFTSSSSYFPSFFLSAPPFPAFLASAEEIWLWEEAASPCAFLAALASSASPAPVAVRRQG